MTQILYLFYAIKYLEETFTYISELNSIMDAVQPNLFIFGSERSGTTLLCALLSEHHELFFLNDSFIFDIYAKSKGISSPSNYIKFLIYSRISPLPKGNKLVSLDEAETYLKLLIERYQLPNKGQNKPSWLSQYSEYLRLDDILKKNDISYLSLRDLFNQVYSQLVPNKFYDRKFFGEKTPCHLYLSPWIKDLYPNSKTITLIRNPISNIASINKRKISRDLEHGIKIYLSFHGKKYESLYEQKTGLLIRYEDLIKNSEATIAKIYDYLDLAPSKSVGNEFSFYIKQGYVGNRIDPQRDAKLIAMVNDEQKKLIKRKCSHIFERYYPELL